jgi:hypothetical protein
MIQERSYRIPEVFNNKLSSRFCYFFGTDDEQGRLSDLYRTYESLIIIEPSIPPITIEKLNDTTFMQINELLESNANNDIKLRNSIYIRFFAVVTVFLGIINTIVPVLFPIITKLLNEFINR